jgi:hypothetical protein
MKKPVGGNSSLNRNKFRVVAARTVKIMKWEINKV